MFNVIEVCPTLDTLNENSINECRRAQQSLNYRHLAFSNVSVDDNGLSRHVLISNVTEMFPTCKALKLNGETIVMRCSTGKIILPQLRESNSH